MTLFYLLIGIMLFIGVLLLLQAIGVFKSFDIKWGKRHDKKNNLSTSEYIDLLNGNSDESAKTDAILSLLHSSYFYIQTERSQVNNYDDNAQSVLFSGLLTPSAAKSLSALNGKNGCYSF